MVHVGIAIEDGPRPEAFEPLPIDNGRGFPQSFLSTFSGTTYHFRLLAAVGVDTLSTKAAFFELPTEDAHLVAVVEREDEDGGRRVLMARKVVPGLVYRVDEIELEFPTQRLARASLNGLGEHGSEITGWIGPRWA